MKITNHDLHLLLVRVEAKLDSVKEWQVEHQENDSKQFLQLNKSVTSMNRYAASIAIVASFIGATGSYIWQKITGKV